jgi:hypothetical protein
MEIDPFLPAATDGCICFVIIFFGLWLLIASSPRLHSSISKQMFNRSLPGMPFTLHQEKPELLSSSNLALTF